MVITSTKNERIKSLQKLAKSSERKKENIFVIEGIREIEKAVKAGYRFTEVFFSQHVVSEEAVNALFGYDIVKTAVSNHVFDSIAYRENRDGIIALAKPQNLILSDLKLSKCPLLIVLEAVEKPGNLGAMLRTADAAGADAIIVCDPVTDIYNPNVIRASLGCIFTKPVVCCKSEEAIAFFRSKNVTTIATTPYASSVYFEEDLKKPIAIVMGTEADGLSEYWLKNTDLQVKVPMLGIADSLNVSVCLSVVLYESVRQRMQAV